MRRQGSLQDLAIFLTKGTGQKVQAWSQGRSPKRHEPKVAAWAQGEGFASRGGATGRGLLPPCVRMSFSRRPVSRVVRRRATFALCRHDLFKLKPKAELALADVVPGVRK